MNLLDEYKRLAKEHGDLRITYDEVNGLYTISYLHAGVDWNNYLYRMARGLVLDVYGEIITHPYDKFFNLGELTKDSRPDLDESIRDLSKWNINKKVIGISEKIDGTLANVSFDKYIGELIISTTHNSSPDTEMVHKIKKFIYSNPPLKSNLYSCLFVHPEKTLMLEWYDPKFPLAYSYGDKPLLFLHGARNLNTNMLFSYEELKEMYDLCFDESSKKHIKLVKDYTDYSKDDILKLAKTAKGMEGFVVTFEDGQMFKIKTQDYLKLKNYVQFLFGGIATRRKTELIIDKYFDGSLDDIYGMLGLTDEDGKRKQANDYIEAISAVFTKLKKEAWSLYPTLYAISKDAERKKHYFTQLAKEDSKGRKFEWQLMNLAIKKSLPPDTNENELLKAWWRENKRERTTKWIIGLTGYKEEKEEDNE